MAWDSRGYYYRSRKVNGLARREYFGRGPAARAAAHLDLLKRRMLALDRLAMDVERAELKALDDPLDELDDLSGLLARAALLAAGYRQHRRGEWRKWRGKHDEIGRAGQ